MEMALQFLCIFLLISLGNAFSYWEEGSAMSKDDLSSEYDSYDDPTPSPINYLSDQGVKILELTRYRSGSSFVGNLFGHHPDVYYVPEPMMLATHLGYFNPSEVLWDTRHSFEINPIYNCSFDLVYQLSLENMNQIDIWKSCFCYRRNYSAPAPREYEEACHFDLGELKDPNYLPQAASTLCKMYKHIVIKTIRLKNMSVVQDLIEDMDVKIVHLIRDPRGEISSILPLNSPDEAPLWKIQIWARSICEDLRSTLDSTESLIRASPFIANNYVLVRYEDIAFHTETMTRQLYQFAGVDFHQDVKDWISYSTTVTKGSAYDVLRNSTAVAEAWTQRLTPSQILIIQEDCQDVLYRLGYDLIQTPEDLAFKNPVMETPQDLFIQEHYLNPWL